MTVYITEANDENYRTARTALMWGLNSGPKNMKSWLGLKKGDRIIFVVERQLMSSAEILETFESSATAISTFGHDTYGGVWRLLIRTGNHVTIHADKDLTRIFGGRLPGFRRVKDETIADLKKTLGDQVGRVFGFPL